MVKGGPGQSRVSSPPFQILIRECYAGRTLKCNKMAHWKASTLDGSSNPKKSLSLLGLESNTKQF
jgi:hypothetical protein